MIAYWLRAEDELAAQPCRHRKILKKKLRVVAIQRLKRQLRPRFHETGHEVALADEMPTTLNGRSTYYA